MDKERRFYLRRCLKLLFALDGRKLSILYHFADALK